MEARKPSDILKKTPSSMTLERQESVVGSILPYIEKKQVPEHDVSIIEILQEAASFFISFPPELSQVLPHLHKAYKAGIEDKPSEAMISIFHAVNMLIDEEFREKFSHYLKNNENIKNLDFRLLYYINQRIGLPYLPESLVEAGIRGGKIYWRVTRYRDEEQVDKLIWRREGHEEKFNFDEERKRNNTWFMYWHQFRVFKDSGKRGSSVRITKELFQREFVLTLKLAAVEAKEEEKIKIAACQSVIDEQNAGKIKPIMVRAAKTQATIAKKKAETMQQQLSKGDEKTRELAGNIWDSLKRCNILNNRDRLSNQWRSLSGQKVSLYVNNSDIDGVYYPVISEVLFNISKDERNSESIDLALPGFSIFRPEKAPKTWDPAKFTVNKRPENKPVTKWEVAIYGMFGIGREGLECDHIPSSMTLREEKSKKPAELKNEDEAMWWAIALPKKLHRISPTTESEDHPDFLNIIQFYFENLEKYPEIFNVTKEDYWKALGAFRYLYRCQAKEHADIKCFEQDAKEGKMKEVKGINAIGKASFSFFANPEDTKRIDALFVNKIKSFLGQDQTREQQEAQIQKVEEVRARVKK